MNTSSHNKEKSSQGVKKSVLTLVAAMAVGSVVFGLVGARTAGERSTVTPRLTEVEYMVIPPRDLGLDLEDVARRIDYEATTARLNVYAADGWRVSDFGMFGYAAVVLERDVIPAEPGRE